MSEKRGRVLFLSHYLLGVRFDNWLRLLVRAHGRIDPKKLPEAAFITLLSLVLAPFALLEGVVCALPIAKTELRDDPVFVLGHWRSGTTYLQNVLSRDAQFKWPDPVETAMFSNRVLLGWLMQYGVKAGIRDARPMDNVQYALDMPMEETFAVGNHSPYTLIHLLAFPNVWEKYIPCAFVDDLLPRERAAFKRTYMYTLRKLAWLGGGRRLLLKSPDNTARLAALSELFPNAKYINIYRNPYDTVLSTVNMFRSQLDLVRLSVMPDVDVQELIEDVVVERIFAPMYRGLFAREAGFAPGQYVSVRYEDFVRDPEAHLKRIYDTLGLGGYDAALPAFRAYVASQSGYRKNRHTMRPELRAKINRHLGFFFERYGYDMIPDGEEA